MEEYGEVDRYGCQQQRAICFSNEKKDVIAIKETNKYKGFFFYQNILHIHERQIK